MNTAYGGGVESPVSDLRRIRSFLAVAESGSFSRAADHLHLTQQAVSLHVKRLERDLGVALLVRTTRSVTLTDVGREFAIKAQLLVREFDRLWSSTRAAATTPRGTVRIGMSAAAAHEALPELIEAVAHSLPTVELTISEMNPIDVFEGLRAGNLDVGMTLEPPEPHGLRALTVRSGRLAPLVARHLATASGPALGIDALRSMTLVLPNPQAYPHLHSCGLRFAVRNAIAKTTTAVATSTLPRTVFAGAAFALWPTVLPDRYVPAGLAVVTVADDGEAVDLWMSYASGSPNPALMSVVELAREIRSDRDLAPLRTQRS